MKSDVKSIQIFMEVLQRNLSKFKYKTQFENVNGTPNIVVYAGGQPLYMSLYLLYIDYLYSDKTVNDYVDNLINKTNKGIIEVLKIKENLTNEK